MAVINEVIREKVGPLIHMTDHLIERGNVGTVTHMENAKCQ